MLRRTFLSLTLLVACAVASPSATVKGEKTYKPFEKIVLKATDITSSKASFLWDVDGTCDTVEAGETLYVWAAPGTYRVRLTAIDFEAKKVERASFTFRVGGDPIPPGPWPPDPFPPDPPDPPGPKPDPAPIPLAGFRVLIVYESSTASKIPPAQQSILYSVPFHKYLDSVCTDDLKSGTKKAWWVLDKDVDTSSMEKHWQDAMKRERKSIPWIIISNGRTGYEGPLPPNITDTTALLKKYLPSAKKGR